MRIGSPLIFLALSGLLPSSAPAAESLTAAQAESQKQLDASLRELTDLRDRITAERLPLSRQLEELERKLAALRRDQGETLKSVDQSGLDAAMLQSELKLRQEEAAYLGSLLDEYARTFESRLDPSELPRYKDTVEAARSAHADASATAERRFEQQAEVVKASVLRVQEILGGARYEGSALDSQGVMREGRFALIGPIALFASNDGTASGLALPQTGSTRPAVRSLEQGELTRAVATVVTSGEGMLPLDPTRGGALKELMQRASLVHLFRRGGPIMWPLLLVSILALATVIERIVFLTLEQRKVDDDALQRFLVAVQSGHISRALEIARRSRYFVIRSLGYALEHRERSLPSALMYANAKELKRFTRGLPILDTSITISPLLGLLGTVTGMMHSFSLIGGELSAPGAITGGIAEALIATAFGLGIAIVALIPFNYLNNRVEEVRHDLETAAAQLELMVRTPSGELVLPVERIDAPMPEPVEA